LTLPVRISEQAEAEMAEAARWYETHRAGLGAEFLDAVDGAVTRIAETPQMRSMVPRISDVAIRRMPVRRFPYHVVYLQLPNRLQVLAIAHDRRRPGYWVGRLPTVAKIGNVHLKWAFSEAAVLFLRKNSEGQKHLRRVAGRHGQAKALSILAAKLGRAVSFMLRRDRAFDLERFLAHGR
jgi:plasmid stabilization system protein ParE